MKIRAIDPRLPGLLNGQPHALQFIALALFQAMPPEVTDAVLQQLNGVGADTVQVVAGMPIHFWNGKMASQMLRDLEAQPHRHGLATALDALEAIRAAFAARGWGFGDDLTATPITGTLVTDAPDAGKGQGTQLGPDGVPPVKRNDDDDNDTGAGAGDDDNTAGNNANGNPPAPPAEKLYAGKPLGHWAGKTREQLLAANVPGKAADKILAALDAKALAAPAEPPAPQQ